MADTGLRSHTDEAGSTVYAFAGRLKDDDNSTFAQTYSFSGQTQTSYFHNFEGDDLPAGSVVNGCELIVHGRYDPTYTAMNAYFGLANDSDGSDSGATGATYSDICVGDGNPSGCSATTGIDNGGGSISGDGGTAVWDLPSSFATTTFGANDKKWALDWTNFTDMSNLSVKVVAAYDISSGIFIFDFAELHLKLYYTAPATPPSARLKVASGKFTLKGGTLKLK